MKVTILLAAIAMALSFSSCESDNSYVIEGSVYGGRNFEDQTIYLTPLTAASIQEVSDSAVIHDGHFRFEGEVDEDGVYVLRMRPMMKLFIGEPFVVKEPGQIRVRLNQVSSVGGTPQNDSLQAWFMYKSHTDSLMTDLKKLKKRAPAEQAEAIEAQRDSVKAAFDIRCRQTVSLNNNAFGEFVDKWYVR